MPAKQIRINAFDMNCVSHIQHGLWTHPRDRSTDYRDIAYWQDLARTAERGLLDGVFLADILGVYDVHGGGPEAAITNGVQIPVNDPLLVVPAMAAVTEHLGFGVTANLSYEPPYSFARRMSTLDHLTKGRIGWNIVTGYLDSAARGMGFTQQRDHDDRYDVADDYLDVVYKLWEASWDDDAVVRDRASGVYARADRVRAVRHHSRFHQLNAIHLCEPSPQRTPVLYQAGASTRGRAFAARHAECVFTYSPTTEATRAVVKDLRAQAVAQGREASDILVFAGRGIVVGRTTSEAREKYEEYRRYASVEGALAHTSATLGVDLAKYQLDEPIRYEKNNANNSMLEAITVRSREPWTLRKIIDQMTLGSRNAPLIGSAEEVADALQTFIDETDVDGFNLSRTVAPESLRDFVDLVVPILQERGAYKTAYAPGTLREKLFGEGRAKLPAAHRGAQVAAETRRALASAAE
ncbi:MAG: LLM class flavin-dependent oxidoreductase [Rhizobiales bacterium]|nr:LLM class flavin-dependent oxidoreductase [Hyphomicrobiales bacterium]